MAESRIPGPLGSLKALGRTAIDVLRTRAELFSVEVSQERARFARLALTAALAAVATGLALQLAAVFVVASLWDTPYRLVAAIGVAFVFVLAGTACAGMFWRALASRPRAFDASLRALEADVDALR